MRANVQSYRDLPVILYQIQTKFRDEPRPRAGLIRVREFAMKDAYSFNADDDSLDDSYQAMAQAYRNIFRRCGLPVLMADADSGAIGGKDSHEFLLITPTGEDTVIHCASCRYTANAEKAEAIYPELAPEPEQPLEEIATPGLKTIAGLADFLDIPAQKTLKAVFYMADGAPVFVTIRGDLEVNEVKLKNALHADDLRMASDAEVAEAGLVAGSASAIGLEGITSVGDLSISSGSNFVVGANKPDFHLRGANYPRDFKVDILTDITLAQPGHLCPNCRNPLDAVRGIEVGHIFKLGTGYAESFGATYLDSEGQQQTITMGCYGIGVGRLLAAGHRAESRRQRHRVPRPHRSLPGTPCRAEPHRRERGNRSGEALQKSGIRGSGGTLRRPPGPHGRGQVQRRRPCWASPYVWLSAPGNLRNGMIEMKERKGDEAVMVPLAEVAVKVPGVAARVSPLKPSLRPAGPNPASACSLLPVPAPAPRRQCAPRLPRRRYGGSASPPGHISTATPPPSRGPVPGLRCVPSDGRRPLARYQWAGRRRPPACPRPRTPRGTGRPMGQTASTRVC